jgi:hypothetical protein
MKELSQSGFIALISVSLVSVILLGMTLSLTQFGIVSRFNLLLYEEKHMSRALAESCLHYAKIFIVNDSEYTIPSPRSLPVGEAICTLVEVTKGLTTHTIKTQGSVRDTVTNLVVELNTEDGTLVSWKEVASF